MSNHLREDRDILHLMERTKKAMAENVTIPRAQHEALMALATAAQRAYINASGANLNALHRALAALRAAGIETEG